MRKEAEAHAEDDLHRKELIETRNNADNAAYAAEKALRDLGDKVPEDMKKKVNEQVANVRQVMNGDDVETIRKATEELNQVLQQIGTAAYQQSGPAAGSPEAGPQPGSDDGSDGGDSGPEGEDVVDGEFRNAE